MGLALVFPIVTYVYSVTKTWTNNTYSVLDVKELHTDYPFSSLTEKNSENHALVWQKTTLSLLVMMDVLD